MLFSKHETMYKDQKPSNPKCNIKAVTEHYSLLKTVQQLQHLIWVFPCSCCSFFTSQAPLKCCGSARADTMHHNSWWQVSSQLSKHLQIAGIQCSFISIRRYWQIHEADSSLLRMLSQELVHTTMRQTAVNKSTKDTFILPHSTS